MFRYRLDWRTLKSHEPVTIQFVPVYFLAFTLSFSRIPLLQLLRDPFSILLCPSSIGDDVKFVVVGMFRHDHVVDDSTRLVEQDR